MISTGTTSRTLILGILTLTCTGLATLVRAQQAPSPVLIQVRAAVLRANTAFAVRLRNDLSAPITFCTDFGRAVHTGSGTPQAAPNPFELQKWTGKQWDTQLIGSDVGSGNTAVSVDAHNSRDFTVEINGPGRYRLRLTYLEGESDAKCPLPTERATKTSSKPFSMRSSAQK